MRKIFLIYLFSLILIFNSIGQVKVGMNGPYRDYQDSVSDFNNNRAFVQSYTDVNDGTIDYLVTYNGFRVMEYVDMKYLGRYYKTDVYTDGLQTSFDNANYIKDNGDLLAEGIRVATCVFSRRFNIFMSSEYEGLIHEFAYCNVTRLKNGYSEKIKYIRCFVIDGELYTYVFEQHMEEK